MEIITRNREETLALGKNLGESLQPGDIVLLFGDLGAGKTTFTQGIAHGLGMPKPSTSAAPPLPWSTSTRPNTRFTILIFSGRKVLLRSKIWGWKNSFSAREFPWWNGLKSFIILVRIPPRRDLESAHE